MKKFVTLATAGIFLLTLQGARAQKEVAPPAIPPMLEGSRPLAQPETKEPAASKQMEEGKTKAQAKKPKSGKKAKPKKKASKIAKKKAPKNN